MIEESDEVDFLEVGWLVEAGRVGVGRLPGEVSDGLVGGVVASQDVDEILVVDLASADGVQPHLEPGIPSISHNMRSVLSQAALVELIAKRGAVSVGVGDVSEEKFALGADLELEVIGGVAIRGGDEDLDDVFLP